MVPALRLAVVALLLLAAAPARAQTGVSPSLPPAASPSTQQAESASSGQEVEEATRLQAEAEQLYQNRSDFSRPSIYDARPLVERALALRERRLGSNHPDTLQSAYILSQILLLQREFEPAKPLLRRVLNYLDATRGVDHQDSLEVAADLARASLERGPPADAEALYRRVYQTRLRLLGPRHPSLVEPATALADLFERQRRFAEAEPFARLVMEVFEQERGWADDETLTRAAKVARLYQLGGLLTESTDLYQRIVETRSRTFGWDDHDTIFDAFLLARMYVSQRRYAEAEAMYRQLYDADERRGDEDEFLRLTRIEEFAALYTTMQRYDDAETIYRRGLALVSNNGRFDDIFRGIYLGGTAHLRHVQGKHVEAERLFLQSLEIWQNSSGQSNSMNLVEPLTRLVNFYVSLDRYEDAAPLSRRIIEAIEGRTHDTIFNTDADLDEIALLSYQEQAVTIALGQSRFGEVDLRMARGLLGPLRELRRVGSDNESRRVRAQQEAESTPRRFALVADAFWAGSVATPASRPSLLTEAFAVLQESVAGSADRSIAEQAALREIGRRGEQFATLIRERGRLQDEIATIQAQLNESFGAGSSDSMASSDLRDRVTASRGRLSAIDAQLQRDAPDYFSLVQPQPAGVGAAQALLTADEAILLAVPSRFGTHVIAITRETIAWQRSDWTADQVAAAVRRLRWDAGARVTASDEEMARLLGARSETAPPAFDRHTAHQLYQHVVAPVLSDLVGKKRLFIAAGGPLAGLPFALLVSAPPPAGGDDDPMSLRATRWFADDFELTHIPSIQSLAILRAQRSAAPGNRFVGVGNPRLAAASEQRNYRRTRSGLSASRLFARGRTRNGSPADISSLREMPSLPGTAVELRQVRDALGGVESAVLEAEQAIEPSVRRLDFTRTRLVLFSTHGLTTEESLGAGEPGLVLTPPAPRPEVADEYLTADPADDGYLSASEVTTLRMEADWVVLSACNTATGDDNASLSALARAFFYAGARNLLASHWPVSDDVAPALITRTVAPGQAGLSRGAALQRAMRSIREDPARAEWAHPFYWAPFVLIGDGASGQ